MLNFFVGPGPRLPPGIRTLFSAHLSKETGIICFPPYVNLVGRVEDLKSSQNHFAQSVRSKTPIGKIFGSSS